MNPDQDHVSLNIAGTRKKDESIASWTAEVYELDGLSRGAESRTTPDALPPDAVLELELSGGARILVAAEDAGRYFGTSSGRGEGEPGGIDVGQVLHFSGPRQPSGVSRDGLGAWVLKSLRIYRTGPAGMTALAAAGTFQDAQLDDRNGLYRCASTELRFTKVNSLPVATEPTLLFLHGTASSTEGSFGDLWRNTGYRSRLASAYGQRIFAFEHRSLTESPVANALDLVRTLPKGARLHVVSHSRGGMVGELLARANRVDLEPVTDEEVTRFLEHAKRVGRTGFETDAERLRELNAELRKRSIQVERFVRVACPARGTTLASDRLDRWASVMLNLFGKGFDAAGKVIPGVVPIAKGYGLLKNFLLAVVKQHKQPGVLPGLEAMMPDSPLVSLLNAPNVTIAHPVHVLAGDYRGDGLLPWLGDCLSEVFYGGETDLVVNTPSMSGGAARARGIHQKVVSGRDVTHFTYFERDESALALFDALGGQDAGFELVDGPSTATISRGGKEPKRKDNAPIVFLLPGIMGSHIKLDKDRVWFHPLRMCTGGMSDLKLGAQGKVEPDGWMDRSYEALARHLADTHEVRPFVYDWRLSIGNAAQLFGTELDKAMADARQRKQPLRIVAHSMGGLVARLALKGRWDAFKAIPGSRLLQLGTPNKGSHSIVTVLMGRDDFVQTIERWFDWKHDMREFLEIVRDFPGVLELLPWRGENGFASDGADYFDAGLWQTWFARDQDKKRDRTWVPPQKGPLEKALAAVRELDAAELDPSCTLYVAGKAPTPAAVRVVNGKVQIGWIDEGDGRVPWKTGIPPGVPAWYTDVSHGDLANHEKAFAAYLELIETGDTRQLTRTPGGARGESAPVFRVRGLDGHALYPSADEVLAAATGSARRGRRAERKEPPASIEVFHGSLASAESPVMVGAYANDSLRGSAGFLNGHLGNQLSRTFDLGLYPSQSSDAMVFLNQRPGGKPGGAIVVGLGPLGDLLPGRLTQALTNGLLEYARSHEQCRPPDAPGSQRLSVSSLLVGTGFTGLTVDVGARCLLDAVRRANNALAQAGMTSRISRVTVFEEVEDRAIAAVEALRDLVADAPFAGAITFDGRLLTGEGGYRGRSVASGGQPGAYRAHVVADDGGGLRFTVITDRARNEVAVEANQRQAVDGLIATVTRGAQDHPGLSRALFELLVPNGMKDAVADVRTLMMSVDAVAASYPWELMRDTDRVGEHPLAARVELVRQLASPHGRGRVPTATENRAFVVGDTVSNLPELVGAQEEGQAVAEALTARGCEVKALLRATAEQVFEGLFCGAYRYMHLAGHGVVKDKETGLTGMVLGSKTYLTSAQVNKIRRVPEFVFINCCHLGSMTLDSQPRWGELAANLGTQFIELGCKAVIAAGWEVADDAAVVFAETFYAEMSKGVRFGQAVLRARAVTYDRYPNTSTWGAFQAYGDERYSFRDTRSERERPGPYVHASHLIADLEMISARLVGATAAEKADYYRAQIDAIAQAARGPGFQRAAVLEEVAKAWTRLGEKQRAIAHYRAALTMEDAGLSLKGLEQLANLEIRYGAGIAEETKGRAAGEAYMGAGLNRLKQLVELGPTAERLSLLGSYWKRQAGREMKPVPKKRRKGVTAAGKSGKAADPRASLKKMQQAYWRAAEHGHTLTGDWDYYPLLNALDAEFLIAARGERRAFDARAGQLSALLRAAAENGERRFAVERSFFHAMAPIEARRVDALWACYDGRADACITRKEILGDLVELHRDLLRRLGTAGERDSATYQLRFLIGMLPPDGTAKKVRQALDDLLNQVDQLFRGGKPE
jgi:pimeloyl-ACP methyl ester carboxylesterase